MGVGGEDFSLLYKTSAPFWVAKIPSHPSPSQQIMQTSHAKLCFCVAWRLRLLSWSNRAQRKEEGKQGEKAELGEKETHYFRWLHFSHRVSIDPT